MNAKEKNEVNYLKILAGAITEYLEEVRTQYNIQENLGFTLLVFRMGEYETPQGMGGDYVSNASREDMIRMMRETADRLEKNLDDGRDSDIQPRKGG